MTRRRSPMNIDDSVEYLTQPARVLHALRNDPEVPKRAGNDKCPAEFYPAIKLKEGSQ
jgi:hypothetical protein